MSETMSVAATGSSKFGYDARQIGDVLSVEVWPLSGVWTPFVVLVPTAQRGMLNSVSIAPREERVIGTRTVRRVDVDAGAFSGIGLHNEVSPGVSARIFLGGTPREIQFGPVGKPLHVLRFDEA